DLFELGGAQPFPFLQNMFGNQSALPKTPEEKEEQKKECDKETIKEPHKKDTKEKKYKYLDAYCENLTKKAKSGNLDKIIGRHDEIARVIQILNRRTKNNSCLIGEPGVGKTAIAEGIAIKLFNNDVPPRMIGKQLYLLDLTALIAGTQFRGQFESRVKGLVDDVKNAGNIILFIDELHNLVGAGDSEGSMNAANILKPALSRGEIQVIGATTFNEYRKHIEKDSALERRFQPITVNEPSMKQTIDILLGIKGYYELFHNIKISDEIVRTIALLSEKYITDRFLPDKAIDLLDESCSYAILQNPIVGEYDMMNRELKLMRDEINDLEMNDENNQICEEQYERIANCKAKLLQLQERLKAIEPQALGMVVTDQDVANVIELWTGIPATKIRETEMKKIMNLGAHLESRVIGQDEAVELVVKAIKRSRVQISARVRPASFIFVGPTGVGKTELVKVLAKELFDTADPLIRLDMSEFMDKYSVSRIVGAPPGYLGYDEAGQLTEKVRRKPYSVVLFDEIEKAHPDVMNILLQILDEGKVTDSHGRVVSFQNTVIVMTSNAGSERKESSVGFYKQADQQAKEKAHKALSEFLRPEFLARVDEIVAFRNLSQDDFVKIADLMLTEFKEPLLEKHVKFIYEQDVLELIAKKAYGNKSGARDISKIIRKEVEDKVCSILIENNEKYPNSIQLFVSEDALDVRFEK
ncbi:MAG: ATP-dependent Clp protease ATP-binding subunit, partial [Oscillospiraceae bacterium]